MNVSGLYNKLSDLGFLQTLQNYDIICLLETFVTNIENIESIVSSHLLYFKPAIKISNFGRASGGVIVLVKKSILLSMNVTLIEHDFDNIVCKLNNFMVTQSHDLFIISTYLPPHRSPYYRFSQYDDGFSLLEDFFSWLYLTFDEFSIILCGDLNARLGDVQPSVDYENNTRYIENNVNDFFNYEDSCDFERYSEDKEFNAYGRLMYDFCVNYSLFIMNGLHNCKTAGAFTFSSPNGNSVIDYFIVSQDILNVKSNMNVLHDITSWHMPITLQFIFNFETYEQELDYESINTKIVWDDSKIDIFCSELSSLMTNTLPSNLEEHITSDVNSFVSEFSNMLVSACECMSKTFKENNKLFTSKTKWYDKECFLKRKDVKRPLKIFTNVRSETNRQNYVQSRNEYNSLLTRKKYLFSISMIDSLINSATRNSTSFWKHIKTLLPGRKCNINTIQSNEWFTYFSNFFNSVNDNPSICNENTICYTFDQNELDKLNSPITFEECIAVINGLKCSKAHGVDNVLNEMIIFSKDNICEILTLLFNYMFQNSIFASEWQKSLISPIFKKGNVNLCSNYRPITLTSLLSKLYTGILNNRLTLYTVNLNIIPEEQAAFRKDYSTIDNIFTLYTLVCKQFSQNRKLYVAFIDYRRCFDNINRLALFTVLNRYGINGKFLDALKSIYSSVKSAVKVNNNNVTDFFNCPIGLKQGCILSPILFNIFISEVSTNLNKSGIHGLQLVPNLDILHHLFYADDNCIFSTTPVGLQNKLDILHRLSLSLGMEVNLDKTKIIVFRKGGHLSRFEKWNYNGLPIDIVNSYNYLGITFTTRMSFSNAFIPLIAKAKKCINEILFSLKSLTHFDFKMFMKLFDTKVFPILSYGCELWGLNDSVEIERVHLYAMKKFLNVSLHTSNNKIYSETGRYPLSITHKIRSVKYWLKIKQYPQSRFVKQSYTCLLGMCDKGQANWVSMIRDTLCKNGYGIVWITGQVGNKELFFKQFKQTLIDNFVQGWNEKMLKDSNCKWFYGFKQIIERELYLKNFHMKLSLRNVLAKFRLGVSQIYSHRYKFSLFENQKFCPFCIQIYNEDENHVLFICPVYETVRKEFIEHAIYHFDNITNDNFQFMQFMQSNQYIIAKFLLAAFSIRSSILNNRMS